METCSLISHRLSLGGESERRENQLIDVYRQVDSWREDNEAEREAGTRHMCDHRGGEHLLSLS